ncbi:hypothetical protein EJ05DRAFT_316292 [Pseudovirgaria hyperparasitica]|uniref:Uncharacterized protein n=1 Tax=Pseudovirgaria hyperparasitica TaxID=470096 RepID=A0A6A6WD09_9PEZI|nr:uncharacterized protein EJ05DRAFT_316292 [Pseudovirgaria hyperparasitica]KAF2759944.1 hypothetical protein EJ05DRAFT_316292 [Pseudovirgaria hyperparasitica]
MTTSCALGKERQKGAQSLRLSVASSIPSGFTYAPGCVRYHVFFGRYYAIGLFAFWAGFWLYSSWGSHLLWQGSVGCSRQLQRVYTKFSQERAFRPSSKRNLPTSLCTIAKSSFFASFFSLSLMDLSSFYNIQTCAYTDTKLSPLDASAQCGQLTNYVTVPGPTVTHFIEVEHNRASHNNGVTALGPADNTQTKANGPYMFTEHEGSTVWLGAAPPASITNFIKQTSVIVITPVPSPTATYTSYRTHTSIVTVFPTSAQYTPPSYGASSSNVPSGIFSSTIDTTIHMTQVTTILETLTSTHEGVPTTGWNISTTTSSEDSGYGPGSSVGTVSHLSSWSDVSGSSVYATLTFVVSSSTSVVTLPVGPSGDLSSSQASGTGGSSASRFSTSGLSILPYPTKSWIGTGQSSSSFPTSVMSIAPYPAPTWVTFSSRHGTESSSAPHNSQVEISSHSSSSFPISTTSMIPIPVPTWLTVSSYDDTSSSADTSSPSTSPSFILAPISTSYISAGNSTSTSYAEQSTGTSYLASSSSTLQAVPSATPSSCGEVGDFSITVRSPAHLKTNSTDTRTVGRLTSMDA